MIAEEVTSPSIEEASMTPEQKKVTSNVRNLLTKLGKRPDEWVQAVEDANKGVLAISGYEQLDDELKKFAIEKFFAATRTKEYLAQQTANIAQTKNVPAEEAAEAVLGFIAPDQATPEAAEELASLAGVDISSPATPPEEALLRKFDQEFGKQLRSQMESILSMEPDDPTTDAGAPYLAYIDAKRELQYKVAAQLRDLFKQNGLEISDANSRTTASLLLTGDLIADLDLEAQWRESRAAMNKLVQQMAPAVAKMKEEEPDADEEVLVAKVVDAIEDKTEESDITIDTGTAVEIAKDAIETAAAEAPAGDEPSAVEIKPLLDKFATFIQRTGVGKGRIDEKINYVIKALDLKDTKQFGSSLAREFKREEIQALKDHFEDTNNGALFFKQYFSQDPEFLERFNQALAGESEEEPGEEEEEAEQAPEKPTAPEEPIPDDAKEAYKTAFNTFQKEFLFVPTLYQQGQIFQDLWNPVSVMAGKSKNKLDQAARSLTLGSASKEEEAEIQKEEIDAAEASTEEKKEFKREILERMLVLQKHSNQVANVLKIYEKYANDPGGLKAGSKELFRKYKVSDPKKLLYKLVQLIMVDINSLLQIIANMGIDEKTPVKESKLLEVEGETFVDKVKRVRAVAKSVEAEGDILLSLISKQPSQAAEPPPEEQPPEETEEKPPEDPNLQEEEQVTASVRETSVKIYDMMKTIKEYFPTVQPLKSEYELGEAIQQFDEALDLLLSHIATMQRFKDDSQITKANLKSAQMGLERIKAVIMDVFGVADEGKIKPPNENEASYNEEGEEKVRSGELEEPTTKTPEVEVEKDDEPPEGEVTKLSTRQAIERHMKNYFLPPEVFFEVFENNSLVNVPDNKAVMEAAYDAFTLFIILTKVKQGAVNEQEDKEVMAIAKNPGQQIAAKLFQSGIFTDKEKAMYIMFKVLNIKMPKRAKELGFFMGNVTVGELKKLNIELTKREQRYPFEVSVDNVQSFLRTYGEDAAFVDDEQNTEEPQEPTSDDAKQDATSDTEPTSDKEEAPAEVETKVEKEIEKLVPELMNDPEIQEKIDELPKSPSANELEQLTMDIMEKEAAIKKLDQMQKDLDTVLSKPEVKKYLAQPVEDKVKEKRPEIKMPPPPNDGSELEPDMGGAATAADAGVKGIGDLGSGLGPKKVVRKAFKDAIKKPKSLAEKLGTTYHIGNAEEVIRKHLEDIGTTISEKGQGGRVIKTLPELQAALVAGKAIKADEHSMKLTRSLADALKKLKITFLEPERKEDLQERLATKLSPIIRDILNNRKLNG